MGACRNRAAAGLVARTLNKGKMQSFISHSAAALTIFMVATALPAVAAPDESTQVFYSNGQLEYIGRLDKDANRKLFELYDNLPDKPTELSIRSPGGEVNTGMELGAWIYERKMTVKVMEFCMSSCANYVFPAAAQKIVSNFAVIGYHGGPGDPGKLGFDANTQAIYDALSAEQKKAFMDDIRKITAHDGEREVSYFKRIGVRADLSSLGQDERYKEMMTDKALGWTYTLEDFAVLGVRNITVINPPWKPAASRSGNMFVTIPVVTSGKPE